MPDLPSANLLSRFIFENPLPLGGGLVLIAMIMAVLAWREGRLDRVRLAVIPFIAGAAVLLAGTLVVTPAEHARRSILAFEAAVTTSDLFGVLALLSDDLRFHIGTERNAARDKLYLNDQLVRLDKRFKIDTNAVTNLDAVTTSKTSAVAHVTCFTEAGWGLTPTRWVVRVEEAPDGSWPITRLTWVSMNGRAATGR